MTQGSKKSWFSILGQRISKWCLSGFGSLKPTWEENFVFYITSLLPSYSYALCRSVCDGGVRGEVLWDCCVVLERTCMGTWGPLICSNSGGQILFLQEARMGKLFWYDMEENEMDEVEIHGLQQLLGGRHLSLKPSSTQF